MLYELDTMMDFRHAADSESQNEDVPWAWRWDNSEGLTGNVDGVNHFALEAWERQMTGGMRIEILPTRVSDNPWGIGRFRELLPLNLVSYEDRDNGKWY